MLLAATPLSNFVNANPTIVMLALGFLLMIGTSLIAEGFGAKVPKGYLYAAMAFSALVEGLNMLERGRGRSERIDLEGAASGARQVLLAHLSVEVREPKRSRRYPVTAHTIEPLRTPRRTGARKSESSKARPPIKRLMVKPMPHKMDTA